MIALDGRNDYGRSVGRIPGEVGQPHAQLERRMTPFPHHPHRLTP